jgi:hypothetical protein
VLYSRFVLYLILYKIWFHLTKYTQECRRHIVVPRITANYCKMLQGLLLFHASFLQHKIKTEHTKQNPSLFYVLHLLITDILQINKGCMGKTSLGEHFTILHFTISQLNSITTYKFLFLPSILFTPLITRGRTRI